MNFLIEIQFMIHIIISNLYLFHSIYYNEPILSIFLVHQLLWHIIFLFLFLLMVHIHCCTSSHYIWKEIYNFGYCLFHLHSSFLDLWPYIPHTLLFKEDKNRNQHEYESTKMSTHLYLICNVYYIWPNYPSGNFLLHQLLWHKMILFHQKLGRIQYVFYHLL